MFTGLIGAIGTVTRLDHAEDGLRLTVQSPFEGIAVGESIAIDGACLSVVSRLGEEFTVHLVPTTIARTRFASVRIGQRVNLERALRAGDRLGGHVVQGHVDGLGQVARVNKTDRGHLVDVEVPPEIAAVTIPLGSITIDGVSLTVNGVPAPNVVQVSLIPITLQETTLGALEQGDLVHLEGDLIGKYVTALARPWTDESGRREQG